MNLSDSLFLILDSEVSLHLTRTMHAARMAKLQLGIAFTTVHNVAMELLESNA